MTIINFISPEFVLENSDFSTNIDEKKINGNINFVENSIVSGILGDKLYEDIKNKVYSAYTGTYTYTNLEEKLIENYITPVVLYWTIFYSNYSIAYRATAAGIVKKNTEGSTPIEESEMNGYQIIIKEKAIIAENALKKFIYNNSATFVTSGADSVGNDDSGDLKQDFGSLYIPGFSEQFNLKGDI